MQWIERKLYSTDKHLFLGQFAWFASWFQRLAPEITEIKHLFQRQTWKATHITKRSFPATNTSRWLTALFTSRWLRTERENMNQGSQCRFRHIIMSFAVSLTLLLIIFFILNGQVPSLPVTIVVLPWSLRFWISLVGYFSSMGTVYLVSPSAPSAHS